MDIKEALEYINDVKNSMILGSKITGIKIEPIMVRFIEAVDVLIDYNTKITAENMSFKIGMTMDHIAAMEESKNNKKQ